MDTLLKVAGVMALLCIGGCVVIVSLATAVNRDVIERRVVSKAQFGMHNGLDD